MYNVSALQIGAFMKNRHRRWEDARLITPNSHMLTQNIIDKQ